MKDLYFSIKKIIFNNILVAHENFSTFNKKKGKTGAMVIKLALEEKLMIF